MREMPVTEQGATRTPRCIAQQGTFFPRTERLLRVPDIYVCVYVCTPQQDARRISNKSAPAADTLQPSDAKRLFGRFALECEIVVSFMARAVSTRTAYHMYLTRTHVC